MLKIARMDTNIFLIILKTNIYLNKFSFFIIIHFLILKLHFLSQNKRPIFWIFTKMDYICSVNTGD